MFLDFLLGQATKPKTVAQEPAPAFPAGRELISTVHPVGRDPIRLYMPTIKDMQVLNFSDPQFMVRAAAIATGMSYEQFIELPYTDGSALVHRLADALEVLNPGGYREI